jgi:hypothetical protein
MPAIACIDGFTLRGQRPPPYGSTWDVQADRQHATSGWLMPRGGPPSAMLATAPTVPSVTSRYTSVSDLPRVQSKTSSAPWLSTVTPPAGVRASTPSSAVLLQPVSKQVANFMPETSHRRVIESFRGLPSYDGAAGRATAQLVRSRLLGQGRTEPPLRSGYAMRDIFTTLP